MLHTALLACQHARRQLSGSPCTLHTAPKSSLLWHHRRTSIRRKTQPKNEKSYKCFLVHHQDNTQVLLHSHRNSNSNYLQHYNNTTNIQSPLQFFLQLRKEQKKPNPLMKKSTTPMGPQLNEGRAAAAHRERCRPYSPRAQATATRALGLALRSSWPRASL